MRWCETLLIEGTASEYLQRRNGLRIIDEGKTRIALINPKVLTGAFNYGDEIIKFDVVREN